MLRGQGFTHLLVNQGELSRLAGSYPVAPWRDTAGWRRWNALLAALGPPELQVGGVQLFALPRWKRACGLTVFGLCATKLVPRLVG